MIQIIMAIIDHLRKDTALMTKLGYTVEAPNGVFENQSFNLNEVSYPRIGIGTSAEKIYHPQQVIKMAGKSKATTYFDVNIFSNSSTSLETGEIEQLILERLEGVKIEYDGLLFSGQAQKEGVTQPPARDNETGIWHTIIRYSVVARIK